MKIFEIKDWDDVRFELMHHKCSESLLSVQNKKNYVGWKCLGCSTWFRISIENIKESLNCNFCEESCSSK